MERLTSRQCNKCGVMASLDRLVPSKRYIGGYMPLCKECRNEYWRGRRTTGSEAQKLHMKFVRASRLMRQYGITQAQCEQMVIEQGGKCKLCGSGSHGREGRFQYWNIDHCHKTGVVRGLLCNSCNTSIGKYEKLIEKVGRDRVITYLSS